MVHPRQFNFQNYRPNTRNNFRKRPGPSDTRIVASEVKSCSHFHWDYKIENFSVKKTFVHRFSLEDGKLVLKIQWRWFAGKFKSGSSVSFSFEKIDPSLLGKKFNLEMVSDDYPRALIEIENKEIVPNKIYFLPKDYYISDDDAQKFLGPDKHLNLQCDLMIHSGLAPIDPVHIDMIHENNEIKHNPAMDYNGDEEFGDYEIKLDDGTLKTHRYLLAAHNEVFHKKFAKEKGEMTTEEIKNMPKKAVNNFFKFICTGQLAQTSTYMREYVQLGEHFKIGGVKEKVEEVCVRSLNEDGMRALKIFQLARENNLSKELTTVSFEKVKERFRAYNLYVKRRASIESLNKMWTCLDKFEAKLALYDSVVYNVKDKP